MVNANFIKKIAGEVILKGVLLNVIYGRLDVAIGIQTVRENVSNIIVLYIDRYRFIGVVGVDLKSTNNS